MSDKQPSVENVALTLACELGFTASKWPHDPNDYGGVSSLRYDDDRRIRCAAALAIRMAERPASWQDRLNFTDRRHARAAKLAGHLVKALDRLLHPDQFRYVSRALFDALYLEGAEIITEYDRVQAGLSPRNDRGLTREELAVLDARLVHAMLTPMPVSAPVGTMVSPSAEQAPNQAKDKVD